ncbi:MAG: thiamine pyrophosphate-binding protein [Candidatus Cryptobacteroides sp.]
MPGGSNCNMESRFHYTNERNVQIVIALLKAHGIRRVVVSPGTTNMTFVVSIQNDSWFQLWSSVDERSAAYIACGMAAETREPVVISCTGATASRNYMPGLTEAYYRKLPVLAITSTRGNHKVGHLVDQQIDRRSLPNDIAMTSVTIPMVKDLEDERFCEIEANKAILALSLNGGGPAHMNMYTAYSKDFSIVELPYANAIFRHTIFDTLPEIPKGWRIAIYIGSHGDFTENQVQEINRFCATYDAAVYCDHTSGYRGRYEMHYQLSAGQKRWASELKKVDLMIHIGEVSGDQFLPTFKHVWRVSPDGELRDTWGNLRRVFMMPEEEFFKRYSDKNALHTEYVDALNAEVQYIMQQIPDLPFSNIWMAQQMHTILPVGCELHLGIYNSLRSWNFFKLPGGVQAKCNVGGFGIDGGVSTMIGASFAHPEKLFIGVFGDLAFFYDMNVIGNRHVGNNVRILLINNGKGNEFRNYNHPCYFLGEEAEKYVAAAGHYGNKSDTLIRHYAEDLGYEYMTASDKDDFMMNVYRFLSEEKNERPILYEVFTTTEEESNALESILNMIVDPQVVIKEKVKNVVRGIVGEKGVKAIKKIIK